jgi:hypothetical protein
MTDSASSFDWANIVQSLISVLFLGGMAGVIFLVIRLMRQTRAAGWPGGKVGRERFFSLSNLFPVFRPTQGQLDAWRDECARLTRENEALKSQVQKLLDQRRG